WAPMNNGLTDPDVSTLAIDTTDPSILYAGTGIGGVFKTTDSAGSWTAVNNGLVNPRVTALAVDPTNPSRLYAGTFGRTSDAFLAKLDASGSALLYSTYLGGEYYDEGRGVVVDSQGNAYVTGITRSFSFPTANALQPTPPGRDYHHTGQRRDRLGHKYGSADTSDNIPRTLTVVSPLTAS